MTAWITAGEVLDGAVWSPYWPECALDGTALNTLLIAAQAQCEAFAPALADGATVPESWRLALVMQARALYNAGITGAGGSVGADGMTVQVFPMDWTVKALLRPRRGRPRVA